ncbi:hypothetical protein [Rhizobium sp. RU36D]|uniref:hypothetical protein n=1 Tax=Rhizobium sp. RU36D TaxID=1907415 RepID=UPI0009D8AEC9|nr:hypothetical protein [Rhizobium sp. RU36D]SMD14958.1 hypothetical protein SAMN05880593_1271 [Rhizobium sp. RU36D]
MADSKSSDRAGYALVQVLFDKLDERDRRIAALEIEIASLLRERAERLFNKEDRE